MVKDRNVMPVVSILCMLLLPFSNTSVLGEKIDTVDIGKLSAYEEWVLENLELSDAEKIKSISQLRTFVDTLDGYEAFIFDKVTAIAEAEKQVKTAKEQQQPKHKINALEMKRITLYFELEEYGVTTQDRFDANPAYWKEKAMEAKMKMEAQGTEQASGLKDPTLHYVHQTDVALKRISILTVPLFGYGPAMIPFPVMEYGWNQGTSTAEWGFVAALSGKITFESIICLDSPTHHDSVEFDMNVKRAMKNLLGQTVYNYDKTTSVTHYSEGDCETKTKSEVIAATHSASLSTINDIILG